VNLLELLNLPEIVLKLYWTQWMKFLENILKNFPEQFLYDMLAGFAGMAGCYLYDDKPEPDTTTVKENG
jgi:hypothetical protein